MNSYAILVYTGKHVNSYAILACTGKHANYTRVKLNPSRKQRLKFKPSMEFVDWTTPVYHACMNIFFFIQGKIFKCPGLQYTPLWVFQKHKQFVHEINKTAISLSFSQDLPMKSYTYDTEYLYVMKFDTLMISLSIIFGSGKLWSAYRCAIVFTFINNFLMKNTKINKTRRKEPSSRICLMYCR